MGGGEFSHVGPATHPIVEASAIAWHFAYVHKLEHRPADRMLNFLLREGVQPNQPLTFLSDGGNTVRFAQLGCGDRSE